MSIYKNAPPIVTNGLVFYLDAANSISYISGSSNWIDLVNGIGAGSLLTFKYDPSYGGSIVGNGANTPAGFSPSASINNLMQNASSYCGWFNVSANTPFTFYYKSNNNESQGGYITLFDYYSAAPFSGSYGSGLHVETYGTRQVYWVSSSMPVNSWFNFVVTYDGNSNNTAGTHIYINGVENKQVTVNQNGTQSPTDDSAQNMYIGGSYGQATDSVGGKLSGSLSIVQLYNRQLSQAEVLQNYNAQKSRFNLT